MPAALSADAAQPSVDAAQVAQVAGEGDWVVQGPVEQFGGIGQAIHRAVGRLHDAAGALRPGRAATMSAMIVVAGEALIDLIVHADGASRRESPAAGRSTPRGRSPGSAAPSAFLGRLSTDRFGDDCAPPWPATAWTSDGPPRPMRRRPWRSPSSTRRGTATYRFHLGGDVGAGPGADDVERRHPVGT